MASEPLPQGPLPLNLGDPVALQAADGPKPHVAPEPSIMARPPRFSVLRNSLSFQGMPGLIDIPTATMTPSGSVDLQYNVKRDADLFPGVDTQKIFNFAVGLLPWLTLGGRGTVVTEDGIDIERDISANVQVLLVPDRQWWPSVAVGFLDVSGGRNLFESRYLVMSKELFGRLRPTVGIGAGPDQLDGLFGGVELALNRYITLMGEYDTESFHAGVRLFPLPEKFEAYGIPRPTVDLVWQDDGDFAWSIGLRAVLGEGKYKVQGAALARQRYHRWTPPDPDAVDLQTVSDQLQSRLIAYGMENVRVAMLPHELGVTVAVEYENRRYNRNELHGLGIVLGATATHVPPAVTHMQVVVKEVNLPVLQFTTAIDDFLAFVNGRMSASAYGRAVQISNAISPRTVAPLAATPVSHRSWFKLDLFLRPVMSTMILTERGVADIRFGLNPEAAMQLTPGAAVNVQGSVPVTQTDGFGRDLPDPELERALLHQAVPLPQGPWSRRLSGITQFSVGRFTSSEVGLANETALTLWDGWFFFRTKIARIGASFDHLDRWEAWGNGRVRYAPWDLTFSVAGGRFRDGDTGVAASVERFFGNTSISVFLRHSERGSLGGITLGIPLTVAKELPPWRVRPRLPEVFTYSQHTTVFTERNVLRSDIGRAVPTGHAIEGVYWDRDRLYPVNVRHHLHLLAYATRKWVDTESDFHLK